MPLHLYYTRRGPLVPLLLFEVYQTPAQFSRPRENEAPPRCDLPRAKSVVEGGCAMAFGFPLKRDQRPLGHRLTTVEGRGLPRIYAAARGT